MPGEEEANVETSSEASPETSPEIQTEPVPATVDDPNAIALTYEVHSICGLSDLLAHLGTNVVEDPPKGKKADKNAVPDEKPLPQIRLRFDRVDNDEKIESEPIDVAEEPESAVNVRNEYTISKSNELLDRLISKTLDIELFQVRVQGDETIQCHLGTWAVDLSSMLCGTVDLSASTLLKLNPELQKHSEDDANPDAGIATDVKINLSVRLARDLCLETEWETATKGFLKISKILKVPERWIPRPKPIAEKDNDGGEDEDGDAPPKEETKDDAEGVPQPRQRFTLKFQWPLCRQSETIVSEEVKFVDGEPEVQFDFERLVYVPLDAIDVLQSASEIGISLSIETEQGTEDGGGKEFVVDPVTAVAQVPIRRLFEPDSLVSDEDAKFRISEAGRAHLEKEREEKIAALAEEREQAKAAAQKSKGKGKAKDAEPDEENEDEEEEIVVEEVKDIFEESNAGVAVEVRLDKALVVSVKPIVRDVCDIVPPHHTVKTPPVPPTASELLQEQIFNTIRVMADHFDEVQEMVDLAAKDRVRKELVFRLNETGTYFALKERLKVAVAEVAHEIGATELHDKAEQLSTLYKELTTTGSQVLNRVFSRHNDNPAAEPTNHEPRPNLPRVDEILKRSHEARLELNAEEELSILREGVLAHNLQLHDANDECAEEYVPHRQIRTSFCCALLRHGQEQEASEILNTLVAHYPSDVDLRRRYASLLLQIDTADTDAARLLRITAESKSATALDVALRAVSLRASGEVPLSQYCIRQASLIGDQCNAMWLLGTIADWALERELHLVASTAAKWQMELIYGPEESRIPDSDKVGEDTPSGENGNNRDATGHDEGAPEEPSGSGDGPGTENNGEGIEGKNAESSDDVAVSKPAKQAPLLEISSREIADVFYRLARAASLRNDWSTVVSEGEKALEHDPKHVLSLLLLGNSSWNAHDVDGAVQSWQRLITLRPNLSEVDAALVYGRLARAYMQKEEWKPAGQALLFSLKNRQWMSTWKWLGQAFLHTQEYEEAIDALAEANILDKYNAEVWGTLAVACVHVKRYREAQQCYEQAMRLGLQDQAIWRKLVQLMQDRARYDEAAVLANNVYDISVLASIKRKQNLHEEAEQITVFAQFGET